MHFFLFFCEQKRKKRTQRKRKDAIVLIILTYVRLNFQLGYAQSFTLTIVATQYVRETKAERQAKRLARLRVRASPPKETPAGRRKRLRVFFFSFVLSFLFYLANKKEKKVHVKNKNKIENVKLKHNFAKKEKEMHI